MAKIHGTFKYHFNNTGAINAVSFCGLSSGIFNEHFINCTIDKTRVNCKNCLRTKNHKILTKQ